MNLKFCFAAFLVLVTLGCRANLPLEPSIAPRNTTAEIDGVWLVDAINKRIRVDRGRAYALDSWFHLGALKVEPNMVVLKDLQLDSTGKLTGYDLPLLGPLKGILEENGQLVINVKGALGPVSYSLVPAELEAVEQHKTDPPVVSRPVRSAWLKSTKPLAPLPETSAVRKPLPVNDEIRNESKKKIRTRDLEIAQRIAGRVKVQLRGKRGFKAKQKAIKNFRLTSAEEQDVAQQGFRTVTIEVGGGGNSPYLIGGSVSQGVALGIPPNNGVKLISSGGLSVGVPGGAGEARVGFWKATVEELSGWSMGVNASLVTPKFVGIGAGVFWSLAVPPQFEGFNVGVTLSPAGVGGDAGLGWTQYTGKIKNFMSDTGRFFTGKPTQHGKELGESCRVGTDCKGYVQPFKKETGISCCRKVCTRMKKNYMKVSMCPHRCRRGAFAKYGTCD